MAVQGNACTPGDPVKKNQALRLQHVATRKWLHSHHFQSPLSNNLEASGMCCIFVSRDRALV